MTDSGHRELVQSVARAWLAILGEERPDVAWTIEEVGTGRVVASSLPRQVNRGVTVPADVDAAGERLVSGSSPTDEDGVDA